MKKRIIKRYASKYDILLLPDKMFKTYSPIQWWEFMFYGSPKGNKINKLPEYVRTSDIHIKNIIRYILINVVGFKTRSDLLKITSDIMKKHYILFPNHSKVTASPLRLLQFAFSEYKIKGHELKNVPMNYWKNDDNIFEALNFIVKKNELCPKDLLDKSKIKLYYNLFETICASSKFKSRYDLYVWFCQKHNIDLTYLDFKTNNFFNDISYKDRFKFYCENIVSDSIITHLEKSDTDGLLKWVNQYLKFRKMMEYKLLTKENKSYYKTLVMVYPIIKEKNLLFSWELNNVVNWKLGQQANTALRELVFYRLKHIENPLKDIPKYLRLSFLRQLNYRNFVWANEKIYKTIVFYKWAVDAFPEYADKWDESMFLDRYVITRDGFKCNSGEEAVLYEHMKFQMGLNVEPVGISKKKIYQYSKYFPDFIIKGYQKPILIEYYGMYDLKNKNDLFVKYVQKTKCKNEYYNNNNEIWFIDLYPCDLKNNCLGAEIKINTKLMEVGELVV